MGMALYDIYEYKKDIFSLMDYIKTLKLKWRDDMIEKIENVIKNNDFKSDDEVVSFFKKCSDSFSLNPFNLKGDVVVIPFKEKLVVSFFLHPEKSKDYINDDFVDYHYQNKTDPYYFSEKELNKEGLTEKDYNDLYCKYEEEYKERENFYCELLTMDFNFDSIASVGLSYELFTDDDIVWYSYESFNKIRKVNSSG